MKYHHHLLLEITATLQKIFIERVHADKAIEKSFKQHPRWGSRDRKFFAESVFDFVRWWRKIWFLTGLYADGVPNLEEVNAEDWEHFLITGLLLKDLPPPESENLDTQIIIDEYQSQLKKLKQASRAIQQSLPDELDEYGNSLLGSEWPNILSALNEKAKIYLRANGLKTDLKALQEKLAQEEVFTDFVEDVSSALVLKERKNVFATKAFKEGLFEVQDAASQMIAPLLNPKPSERIIDACAGAGGKSLHLAALMKNKGRIISLDIHEWKLKELKIRARRNGVDIIETRVIESTKVIKRLEGQGDAVLLDVPCSGSGVIRRNPDTKWKLSIAEIQRLIEVQRNILQSYASMAKPKGRMVYATCSIFPSENQEQVKWFLERNSDRWQLEKEIVVLPHVKNFDGFYAALLKRK